VLAEYLKGETHPEADKVLGPSMKKAMPILKQMGKQYHSHSFQEFKSKRKDSSSYKDVFNPLIEALFMTIRGHNDHLNDEGEASRPACAEGSYLHMLRSIAEVDLPGSEHFGAVEIVRCEG
jgi:hypothetical protein